MVKFNDLSESSNTQLQAIANDLGIKVRWIGFKKDLNKQKLVRGSSYIINIGEGRHGTHWVALAVSKSGKCYYFDSYGAPTLDEVHKFCRGHSLWVNRTQFQGIHEGFCGIWALLFARAVQHDQVKAFLEHFIVLGRAC